MKISFVEIEGFRGVRAHMRIHVPAGFLIITGRNGSGKSTICDAIEFALTGTLSKYAESSERGESTDQYIWWRGRWPAGRHLVRVGLRDADGREIVVTRTPEGLEVEGDSDIEGALCDLTVMPRDPLGQLCRTAIIRDESIAALSIDLPEADRFTFVRTALGTDALDEVAQRGKTVLAAAKKQVESAASAYARARDEVASLLTQLAQARLSASEFADYATAEADVRRIIGSSLLDQRELISAARGHLAALRRRNDVLLGVSRDAQLIGDQLRELDSDVAVSARTTLDARQQELQKQLAEADRELFLRQAEQATEQQSAPLRTTLANLYEAGRTIGRRNGGCPLCGTTLAEQQFESSLNALAGELADAERRAAASRQHMNQLIERVATLRGELTAIHVSTKSEDNVRADLGRRLSLLAEQVRASIGEAPAKLDATRILEDVRKRQEEIDMLGASLSIIEASATLERISELERRVRRAQEESSTLEARLRNLEAAEARGKRLLGGIRRAVGEIVEERLAALDPLLKDLYARLKPHSDWLDLNYKVRGDLKKFLSLRVGEDVNPRFTFSSGQRRAIGLAFLLAVHLSRPWCRLRTLILDDPVQHIDDFRSLHLVEVLGAIRKTGRQVICAVEDEGLAELMCRRIRQSETGEGLMVRMAYKAGDGAGLDRAIAVAAPIRNLILPA